MSDAPQPQSMMISVVVPVYCGSDYLEALVAALDELRREWQAQGAPFSLAEAIFVDDAAIDDSGSKIDRLAREHSWIVPLHLARNFGQHPATIVGILHSSGDWVVTMDEDLQHRPEVITTLLRKAVSEHADIVYANPASAVHDAAIRDWTSRSFKRMMQWLTDNPNLSSFNSFRLIRGPVARAAASVCSHDTYLDITLGWFTQSIRTIRIEMKDERYIKTKRSGYSLKSLLSHGWRMIFSSQIKLLRIGSVLGLAAMVLSVLAAVYFLTVKLFFPSDIAVQGWTSLFLAITFFGGLSAFMLGIVLQYLSSMILKVHGKPTFFTIDRSGDASAARWLAKHSDPNP
ncbi:glycosyltransferase [Paracoccus lutimaris]|uniref:Glycosyltransferase involved in cell wall biosynthesis n=1 Tax=Paracoccus lutimaris TaxID=1490030 RepID=A0A368YN85_9RHOB|nr:glycosyltransferase [Paracoccus lutimaris]RCW81069.1 glycosyltransferase involved in cell wall biosynthesis [Paracoccus lutimaris]